jgi:dTDP-4-amino-4,6-dideoxygalactose transaminase
MLTTCTWCVRRSGMPCTTIWRGPRSRPACTYPCGVHLQKAYAHLGYEPGSYPNAEEAAAQVLSLPVFPQLSDQEVEQVIRLIRIFLAMR